MIAFLTFIHILNCVGLVIVVLLQAGRGAGMAGVFGASTAGTQIFGGRGAENFLGKLTAIMAVVFMVTSITLTVAKPNAGRAHSAVREAAERAPAQGGEIPGTPAGAPSGAAGGAPAGGAPAGGGGH